MFLQRQQAEFDRLLALYEFSRPDFIHDVTPFIQKKMANYFLPDISGDLYIGSYSGVIYDLKIPRATEVIVLGGLLSACLQSTILSIVDAVKNQPAPSIKIVLDGTYQTCSRNDDAPVTLSTCQTTSPDDYKTHCELLKI